VNEVRARKRPRPRYRGPHANLFDDEDGNDQTERSEPEQARYDETDDEERHRREDEPADEPGHPETCARRAPVEDENAGGDIGRADERAGECRGERELSVPRDLREDDGHDSRSNAERE
jgi:hypothetical protein